MDKKKKVLVSMDATIRIKTKPLEVAGGEVVLTPDFQEYIRAELVREISNVVGFERDEITVEKLEHTIGEI